MSDNLNELSFNTWYFLVFSENQFQWCLSVLVALPTRLPTRQYFYKTLHQRRPGLIESDVFCSSWAAFLRRGTIPSDEFTLIFSKNWTCSPPQVARFVSVAQWEMGLQSFSRPDNQVTTARSVSGHKLRRSAYENDQRREWKDLNSLHPSPAPRFPWRSWCLIDRGKVTAPSFEKK